MQSNSEDHLRLEKDDGDCREITNLDRISELPDDLLVCILSFLPLEFAIKTSTLSSRWRYVWTKLDSSDFSHYCSNSKHTYIKRSGMRQKFVHKKISERTHIRKFGLSVNLSCNFSTECSCHEAALISAATEHNAEEVVFWQSGDTRFGFPETLCTNQNLVSLRIRSAHLSPRLKEFLSFSRLKILHLENVRIVGDCIEKIIDGSPVLEKLVIRGVIWKPGFRVCSSSLKRLTIEQSFLPSEWYDVSCMVYVDDAPKLEVVEVADCFLFNTNYMSLQSLVSVTVNHTRPIPFSFNDNKYSANCLKHMPNLKNLRLSSYALKDHCGTHANNHLPVFQNLTHLEVEIRGANDALVLPDILRCTPNLEVLIIKDSFRETSQKPKPQCLALSLVTKPMVQCLKPTSNVKKLKALEALSKAHTFWNLTRLQLTMDANGNVILPVIIQCIPNLEVLILRKASKKGRDDYCLWRSPETTPGCLLLSLRTIELEGVKLSVAQMKMIEYLLKNSMVLNKLVLSSWRLDASTKTSLYKKLSMFPKGSSKCQIVFSNQIV